MRDLARLGLAAAAGMALAATGARAQALSGPALVQALQMGGYVIVMRHAHAPEAPPAQPDRANAGHERQLDEAGRAAATAMGEALKRLRLPLGEVWSSPTYRARETARLAGLPKPRLAPELGDRGKSMQAVGADQGAWLRDTAGRPPRAATDTVIVTQMPNITAAFGQAAAGLGDGGALVFHAAPGKPPELVARVPIDAWPKLEAR